LVPANPYLHEEIPIWLRVYFKASPSLDHHLKWDLFTLPELEGFEAMLNRLLRDELEELVMRYEALRVAISQETDHRAYTVTTVTTHQEAIYSNQLPMAAIEVIHEQQQPNFNSEGRIEELPPDDESEVATSSKPYHGGEEAVAPQQQHNKVSSVDNPHPQIMEEMRMRALNSDFESGV